MLLSYIKANGTPILNNIISGSDLKGAIILLANIDIDTIPKEEQLNFCKLLEHRKMSTFELPKNCVIIVTASNISKETNGYI